jgi:hypothetical protein
MAFHFKEPLDVSSLQKRFQDKESRRSQKHVRKAQGNSKLLQAKLGLSGCASTQICDVSLANRVYGQEANPRLG